jgi:16S rRNA (cytosine967-C5)-methyltransferase
MSGKSAANARIVAMEAVAHVLDSRRTLDDFFSLPRSLEPRDLSFARHLAYGVLRWLGALDWLAARLLNRPLKHRDRDVHRLVLLGLFQLWKDDTADHAAVHATAECAGQMGKGWATGLVNALLRRFQRERRQLLSELGDCRERLAHPAWLLDALESDWPGQWERIADANNVPGEMWLRVNRQRTSRHEIAAMLRAQGHASREHPEARDALAVEPAAPVERIPGFKKGLVSVQDPAAQLAADYLAPRPGQRVLDACAAPGGKTCHILERQPGIDLLALDRDPGRVQLIRENLDRLGLSCDSKAADAGQPEDWWDGRPFDRILLDAPCSATGIIRRHPDIKWLRDPQQVTAAAGAQLRLLDRLWPLLGAGGILVYATCSVLKIENHEQIHDFLERHSGADPVDPPGRQILPGDEGMDGFFYAVIRKPA